MMPYRGNFSVWNVESYSGSSATCALVSDSSVTAVFNIKSDVLEIFGQVPFLQRATVLVDESERLVDSILDISAFCSPTYGRIVQTRKERFDDVGWNLAICDSTRSYCIPIAFIYDRCYEGVFRPAEVGEYVNSAVLGVRNISFVTAPLFAAGYARELILVIGYSPPFGDDPDSANLTHGVIMLTDGPNVYRKIFWNRNCCSDAVHQLEISFYNANEYVYHTGYHCWSGYIRLGYRERAWIDFEVSYDYTFNIFTCEGVGNIAMCTAPTCIAWHWANHCSWFVVSSRPSVLVERDNGYVITSNDRSILFDTPAFIKLGNWVSDTNKHWQLASLDRWC